MIRLDFVLPVGDQTWDAWVAKAEEERQALLASPPEQRKIKDKLYKGGRDFLLTATSKKCAYCETYLPPGERKGDVEHFRPKGRVRDRRGVVVTVTLAGQQMQHPGYFWLAYDYRNLLPVCGACNRRARDEREGRLTGKGEIFPTLDDWYAAEPAAVDHEKPSLLNPWLPEDDPHEHLIFDPETGLVIGRTDRGKETVELLGLNRDGLPEERKTACRNVCTRFIFGISATVAGAPDPSCAVMISEIESGAIEYAAFCRVQLATTRAILRQFLP